MSNPKVKIGILGAGSMGLEHADVYGEIENVQVDGVFRRSRARAEATAHQCGALAVTDPRVLLDDPTIDAIDVCLPTANHPEFVIAALERGKHVFCETPFALTLRFHSLPATISHHREVGFLWLTFESSRLMAGESVESLPQF